ncbi:MAG: ABC transporter permease [Thermodesulfobacteriota bacterium]
MNIGILKIGLNYLKRSLFQSFLLLLGVAVGVSTIVAVDIANISSIRSLESSIRSINTNISHSIVGNSSGFDEKIYTELRSNIRTTNLIPVVEGYLEIVEFHTNPVRIIGLDPIPQLSYLDDSAYSGNLINDPAIDKLISIPNTVFVSQQTAEENQLTIGNNITSNNNGVIHKLRIVGII